MSATSIGLVTVTHDGIGRQIADTAAGILGNPAIRLQHIAVHSDDDPDTIERDLDRGIGAVDGGCGVLVLADLFGATPWNIACRVAASHHARVLSGINLPMMLRVFNYAHLELDVLAHKASDGARIGVVDCGVQ